MEIVVEQSSFYLFKFLNLYFSTGNPIVLLIRWDLQLYSFKLKVHLFRFE